MRATASSVVLKRERVAREHQQARDREAVSVTPHARARTTGGTRAPAPVIVSRRSARCVRCIELGRER
jgi:hypothetical protein